MPADAASARPRVLLAQALSLLVGGRAEEVGRLLDAAERSLAGPAAGEPFEPSVGRARSLLANVAATSALERAFLAELHGDADRQLTGRRRGHGHSVIMVKEALAPHAEYLVRAGFVVLAIDWRTVGSSEGEPRGQWFPERQVEDLRVSAVRALMLQDFERRCQTGQGASIPALPADDPKLAGYIAQAEELFPAWVRRMGCRRWTGPPLLRSSLRDRRQLRTR